MNGCSVKLLLFSDLHLDTPFRWASVQVARMRRLALRHTLSRIVDLANELEVDALLCAGDLYEHDRFTPDTARFVRAEFARTTCRVFVTPGNHDWYGPTSLYHQVDWSPNVHIFAEAQLEPVELANGVWLWGAAHRAPANTANFLDGFAVDRTGVNLALFHGSEQSSFSRQGTDKQPHAPFTAPQIAEAGLAHAFVGHFHSPHDGRWYTYPGNPDPLTFGETGERGAVLVTIHADGRIEKERNDVSTSDVYDVECSLDGITHSGEVRDRVREALEPLRGTVRLTVTGEVPPDVDIDLAGMRGLGSHLDAFLPQLGRITAAYDFEALKDEPTVRGTFVRDVFDADLDETTRQKVLITGLRALDGHTEELEVH
jgi:DNA repair protein SbcD/Mre11